MTWLNPRYAYTARADDIDEDLADDLWRSMLEARLPSGTKLRLDFDMLDDGCVASFGLHLGLSMPVAEGRQVPAELTKRFDGVEAHAVELAQALEDLKQAHPELATLQWTAEPSKFFVPHS